jgi:hypothetical protein
MTVSRFRAWFVLCSAIGSLASAAAEESRPIAVVIDRGRSGFVYRVDSVEVPAEKLLDAFAGLMVTREDRDRRISVMLHEEAPLRMLLDVRDRLDKVGFLNDKYFYYGRDKRMMAEIGLTTRAVPFSPNGEATSIEK